MAQDSADNAEISSIDADVSSQQAQKYADDAAYTADQADKVYAIALEQQKAAEDAYNASQTDSNKSTLDSWNKQGEAQTAPASPPATAPASADSWVDAQTGHRIIRLSHERKATALYFNQNIFTPDGNDMVYLSSIGIHVVHLATMQTRLLYEGQVVDFVMGTRTRRIFFRKAEEGNLSVIDIDSGAQQKLGRLPQRSFITSINSDETKVVGKYIDGRYPDFTDYDIVELKNDLHAMQESGVNATRDKPALVLTPAHAHAVAVEKYYEAHIPEALFTMEVKTGETKIVLKGNDWLAHPQFSPTDPNLILYAHEGPSDKVDRIWTVRTDEPMKARMFMSRAGQGVVTHEFWSPDGKTVWFDRQLAKGDDFTLTSLDVGSGARTEYKISKAEASIHYNISRDGKLFCGDGNVMTHGEIGVNGHRTLNRAWIELLRPNADGTMHTTRLASLAKHDYSRMEPNPHITPDNKYVIFTSNMLGTEDVFAVEIAKTPVPAASSVAQGK